VNVMDNDQPVRYKTAQLKGIFPALLTPYTSDNRIDEQSLVKLVELNLAKKVDGFYVSGSSAEAFLLSLEERKLILDIVADATKGKCLFIAHIGCISTDQAIELGQYAQKVGAAAISSVVPFYYKFSFAEIKEYYFDIVNNVDLPMIIYNFPAFSGFNFNSDNVKEFLDDRRFIGVKHTSSDFYALERFKKENQDIIVYNGYDEMFLAGLSMRADGGIGSTYNFMAEKYVKIKELFEVGDMEAAQLVQTEVNAVIKVLMQVGVFPGVKEAVNMMGIECGECRRPFRRLSGEEKEVLKRTLVEFNLI
jgi:N-acetylneuraminate lyase